MAKAEFPFLVKNLKKEKILSRLSFLLVFLILWASLHPPLCKKSLVGHEDKEWQRNCFFILLAFW